ncbi:MAG: C39 family peptidase [Oscillospiraceae bacterium]|nr:C39 family peptidase [Oscillospiraceae bacterium]
MKRNIWKKAAAGAMALLLTAAYVPSSFLTSAAAEAESTVQETLGAETETDMTDAPEEETAPEAEPASGTADATEAEGAPDASEATEESEAEPLAITVTDAVSPEGECTQGSAFIIRGRVSSEYAITKACGGIYTAEGEKVIYEEFTPNATEWDYGAAYDNLISLGSLPAGEYVFRVAVEADGKTALAADSAFSIVDNSVIAPELAVTGESIPADTLPTNAVFSVRGRISSPYPLTRVWGGVYRENGEPTEVYYEDAPDTMAYDLNATFDNYLDFSLLEPGTYTYRIEASDRRGTTRALIEKEFRIVEDDSAASEIQLYNASYPTGTLMQGRGVSIKGSIFSTYAIESVTGGIYKAEGSDCAYQDEFVFTVEGGRRSFNLSQLDNGIVFDALPEGEYEYRVSVTDVKGFTRELICSPFRIRSTAQDSEKQQALMKGINLTENNSVTDWEQVYAEGVDFVILRGGRTYNGDANYYEDAKFAQHFDEAHAAGLKTGVYLYTSASTRSEMKADIDGLLATLDGRKPDMPVYIDAEAGRQSALGKAALTELLAYGCGLLAEQGYKAGVFSTYEWFRDSIDADALSNAGCEIWLAFRPGSPDDYNLSDFCVTWQYRVDGSVSGIEGNVGEDYRYEALSEEHHAVTLVQPEGGTVSADKATAAYGERVTVTAVLDRRHTVRSVKYNGFEASRCSDGSFAFTMPEEDVTVTVELAECDPAETATDFGIVTEMPVPFGTAGDSAPYHAKPCNERLATLPEALMKLTDDGYTWSGDYGTGKPAWALTLMDYANIYSFIHTHEMDEAALRSVLSDADSMLHRIAFTEEEIDLLLGDDEAAAMAAFASPSTIVIGNKGYCAKWMYCHTPEEYEAEGITPEMVAAVQPNYYNPLYVQQAADAFAQKLYSYTGKLMQTKWEQWTAGDVNLDGTVDAADLTMLRSYLDYDIRLGFAQWASADLNRDSVVDEADSDALEEKIRTAAPANGVMLDVIEFCQYPDYPTGCESVSLYMLLNYYGVDVTVDRIYDLLPMGAQPYDDENGVRHGANPEREFVGDPRSEYSYGVFNDPIAGVAGQFKPGVRTERGVSVEKIKEILDSGHPVLAWYVSAPMRPIMYRWSWLDERGETVTWPGGEHAVVICGYDETSLTYRDPNAGTTVCIDYATFEKSFNELGARIVYYTNETPEKPAEPIASDATLCRWAANDYRNKNVITVTASVEGKTDDKLTITLKDDSGKTVDTYEINTADGTGTDAAGAAVNLPQTGNHGLRDAMLAAGAFLLMLLGGAATAASGVLHRRRKNG